MTKSLNDIWRRDYELFNVKKGKGFIKSYDLNPDFSVLQLGQTISLLFYLWIGSKPLTSDLPFNTG